MAISKVRKFSLAGIGALPLVGMAVAMLVTSGDDKNTQAAEPTPPPELTRSVPLDSTPTPTRTPAPATPTPTPVVTATPEPFTGGVQPVEKVVKLAEPAEISRVAFAAEAGFERIVIQFGSAALPGYRVAYVDRAVGCVAPVVAATPTPTPPKTAATPTPAASTTATTPTATPTRTPTRTPTPTPKAIPLAGSAFLLLRLNDTNLGSSGARTDLKATGTIVETKLTCSDYDAVQLTIGLAGKVAFRVTELASPPRLVVDFERVP